MVVLNAGYAFDDTLRPLGKYQFVSRTLAGTGAGRIGNRFDGTWLAQLPVPLPQHYLRELGARRDEQAGLPVLPAVPNRLQPEHGRSPRGRVPQHCAGTLRQSGVRRPFQPANRADRGMPPVLPCLLGVARWATGGDLDTVTNVFVVLHGAALVWTGALVLYAWRRDRPRTRAGLTVGILGLALAADLRNAFQITHDHFLVLAALNGLVLWAGWGSRSRRGPAQSGGDCSAGLPRWSPPSWGSFGPGSRSQPLPETRRWRNSRLPDSGRLLP